MFHLLPGGVRVGGSDADGEGEALKSIGVLPGRKSA